MKTGIVRACAAQVLNDPPRQGADVRPAMAAKLGFVVHAAKRDALELPSECARYAAAQRGLAHAWRSDKAEDRSLHVRLQRRTARCSRMRSFTFLRPK